MHFESFDATIAIELWTLHQTGIAIGRWMLEILNPIMVQPDRAIGTAQLT